MIRSDGIIGSLWRRLLLRHSTSAGGNRQFGILYAVEDPWIMASQREQFRFQRTNAQIFAITPNLDQVLELGCGEGHQSVYLTKLVKHLYCIDISKKAIARARKRCPQGEFQVGGIEFPAKIFPGMRFDLICACEVLYYPTDLSEILPALMARTNRLYVSNYRPRSERMRANFSGSGWRRLDDITFEDTVWECFLWERSGSVVTRQSESFKSDGFDPSHGQPS